MSDDSGLTSDRLLLAIVALLVDERESRAGDHPNQRKTEVLLSDVGLEYREIAPMVGKSPDAVRMAIRRARAS